MPWIEALTDVTELRQCIRDIIAISILPAIEADCDLRQIADHVAAALQAMLDLEFVFISMREKADAPPIEIKHTYNSQNHGAPFEIKQAASNGKSPDEKTKLETDVAWSDDAGLRYKSVQISLGGYDFIVAASRKPNFPTERQRLLMCVAADAVAVALQSWRAQADSNRFRLLAENSADFVLPGCITRNAFSANARRNIDRESIRAARKIDALTPREKQVLEGLVAGRANKAIAYDLGISVRTVELHRTRLLGRLGTRRLADAIRLSVLASLAQAN